MRRLPIYLVIDTSGSMRDGPIEGVNRGIQTLMQVLRRDPMALELAFLSVITFDDDAKLVTPLTELIDFTPPDLKVDRGLTSLGEALELLAQRIEEEVKKTTGSTKGDYKPVIFIMTDGEPTDDWETGVKRFQQVKSGTVVACAFGEDCDTYILKRITPMVVETEDLGKETIQSFFKWISDSVSSVTISINQDDRERLPPLPQGINLAKEHRAPQTEGGPYTPVKGAAAIRAANKDRYGNPDGPDFDLARDNAFDGLEIGVLHLYTGGGFDFSLPEAALAEKGFRIRRWKNSPPRAKELARALEKCSQLWVISDSTEKLKTDHIKVIRAFFESGRGLYIWGDNDPFYVDANALSKPLLGAQLAGDIIGDQVVSGRQGNSGGGMIRDHLICTGLEYLYEGVTIATIEGGNLAPVAFGSAGNLVIAGYDQNGCRALLDGGFTRLYNKWDTAGTGRYVKNAAAWLTNYERFGPSLFAG